MDASQTESPSMSLIEDLDLWGLRYALLISALELKLFDAIAAGHYTVEAIADNAQCSRRGIRILLDALCPLGLLKKTRVPSHTHIGGLPDEIWPSLLRPGLPDLVEDSREAGRGGKNRLARA